jgi:hypothetical protein
MHLARSFAFATSTLFLVGQTSVALAQTKEPSSTGKGIVGGTLLGAEVVLLTEAAIDVSPDWLYYVGGAAGAIGGATAGYFLEDSLSSKGNMFLLAGGMLLVIPTTVAVLSATAYEQPAEYTQDQPPSDQPVADPAAPGTPPNVPSMSPAPATTPEQRVAPPADASSPTTPVAPKAASTPQSRNWQRHHPRALPTPALVGIDAHKRVHWGIPAVEVRDAFSRIEMARYGVQQRTELRIPLLRVAF